MSQGQTILLMNHSATHKRPPEFVSYRNRVFVPSSVPLGIENLGNSCHLSAVLVAMSSSNILKKYLLRHRFHSLDNRLSDLINSLRLVSGQQWIDGHLVTFKVFRPMKVANMLLKEGYNVFVPQDAEETWSKLCQFIENSVRASKLSCLLSNENVPSYLFDTFCDSPLFGLEQQKTTCTRCGYCPSIRLEPMRTIRVSMMELSSQTTSSFSTLFECLESLKRPERLEMSCVNCTHPFLYRYHQVVRLPSVLCIHVERNYWSPKRKRMMKTNRPLLIPKELTENMFYDNHSCYTFWNKKSHLHKASAYQLKAVVRHHGTNVYGHYTSAVCVSDWKLDGLYSIVDRYPSLSKQWYIVNDTRVDVVDELEILLSGSIYMCVYERDTF